MKEFYEIKAIIKFKKVKFELTNDFDRCANCVAKEICGYKFHCPCNYDEQLILEGINTIEED